MTTKAIRKPQVSLIWAGRDVTSDLAPYIEEFTFTDSLETGLGTRDEITITLNNSDLRFINAWYPDIGDILKPSISWIEGKKPKSWQLGAFALDKIKPRFAPTTVKIAGLSQELTGPARKELDKQQNKAWENSTLFNIVAELANSCQLQPTTTGVDVQLPRIDMRNESIHQFLSRMAIKYNRQFAIKNGSLLFIVPPDIGSISIDLTARDIVKTAEFDVSPRKAYAQATIQYYDTNAKRLITHTETSPQPGERTLTLYDQPNSLDDAIKISKAALDKANKKAGGTGSMTVIGRPIDAGMTIILVNAGKIPSSWSADKVSTTIKPGAGWICRLQLKLKAD